MKQVFDGRLYICYGHAFITTYRGPDFGLQDCVAGQSNGLCGTAFPGVISLCMGLHTGDVGLTIQVFDSEPPLENDWEEIVEAPFILGSEADGNGVWLEDCDAKHICQIPISPGSYRLRYYAKNMDEGRDQDGVMNDEALVDFYALHFWPCEFREDEIVKQTSRNAYYWHRTAQGFSHHDSLM